MLIPAVGLGVPYTSTLGRMTYAATLLRTEIRAVAALVLVVLLFSLGVAGLHLFVGGALPSGDAASRDLIRIVAVGAVLTTLYGAPLYALAAWRRVASWYVAAAIGVVPALALLPLLWREPVLISAVGACGLAIALLTHLSLRSNNATDGDTVHSGLRAPHGARHRER